MQMLERRSQNQPEWTAGASPDHPARPAAPACAAPAPLASAPQCAPGRRCVRGGRSQASRLRARRPRGGRVGLRGRRTRSKRPGSAKSVERAIGCGRAGVRACAGCTREGRGHGHATAGPRRRKNSRGDTRRRGRRRSGGRLRGRERSRVTPARSSAARTPREPAGSSAVTAPWTRSTRRQCGHLRARSSTFRSSPASTTDEALPWLASQGFVLRGAVSEGGDPHTDVDWSVRSALVLGNEATGLDDSIRPQFDELVTVTMSGEAESLNVAIAGAVIFFEALRQRSTLARVPGGGPSRSTNGSQTSESSRVSPDKVNPDTPGIPDLEILVSSAMSRIADSTDLDQLHEADVELLGKRSEISLANRRLGALDPEARRDAGRALGEARSRIEAAVLGTPQGAPRRAPSGSPRVGSPRPHRGGGSWRDGSRVDRVDGASSLGATHARRTRRRLSRNGLHRCRRPRGGDRLVQLRSSQHSAGPSRSRDVGHLLSGRGRSRHGPPPYAHFTGADPSYAGASNRRSIR